MNYYARMMEEEMPLRLSEEELLYNIADNVYATLIEEVDKYLIEDYDIHIRYVAKEVCKIICDYESLECNINLKRVK